MEEPRYLQADCSFRLGAHTVRLTLARSALGVEVEAARTAERWRGDFDAAFIEDLTHKTGNFKQFGIFCSMLESALRRSSASVSLDLLTYADLQTLRTRKTGASARPPPSTPSPLGAKRYLLLVYSVEFDRIHYPLPLPYAGGPDPAALLRELREELAQLRARRDAEIQHLQDKLQRVQEGKRAAEAALRRAEDELLREKTQRQRDHQQLSTELAEMKAAEQRLQRRVKSLTAELAACRRGPPQERRSGSAPRSASRESRGGSQGRPPPRSPSPAGPRPPRFDPTAFVRARQRRQELKNQRRGAAFGSTSPARSRGRSSSAESFRSWRSAVSSSSDADERPKTLPPRGRRATRTRTPLSASSCNGPGAVSAPPRHMGPPQPPPFPRGPPPRRSSGVTAVGGVTHAAGTPTLSLHPPRPLARPLAASHPCAALPPVKRTATRSPRPSWPRSTPGCRRCRSTWTGWTPARDPPTPPPGDPTPPPGTPTLPPRTLTPPCVPRG